MAIRTLLSVVLAVCVSASVFSVRQVQTAEAAFHCMRIHAVMGGYNGDSNIQFVELRMDAGGQTFISGHTIQFFDASGALKAAFTFPSGITNSAKGDSILIGTAEFNSSVAGGTADFVFANANTTGSNGGDPLHPVQVPGGTVVFASGIGGCSFAVPVDSLAYGSAMATYGTAAAALPSPGTTKADELNNLMTLPTNNSTEYALQDVSTTTFSVPLINIQTDFTTPRNNARNVLQIIPYVPGVGGVAERPDVVVVSVASSGDGWEDSGVYAIAGGIAALVLAAGAGLFVYRRRIS